MAEFPTLFGESSHGKTKMWSVHVVERDGTGVIVQKHGYVGAKIVENERVVSVGKNIGKKNETTPVQQAISEARALWNKKRDAAYAPAAAVAEEALVAAAATAPAAGGAGAVAATEAESDDSSEAPAAAILPMLAKDFNKDGKHIVFPCFAQRKLDGVRCVAIPGRGLFSRNGKAFPHLEHIRADLPTDLILDGELYSDELSFQEIVGLVKKETLRPADLAKMAKIHLCVYDCILSDKSASYTARKDLLTDLFAKKTYKSLRLLPTAQCNALEDVKRLHAEYVAEGYEGLILRNAKGVYKVKHRSNDLQKYKEFFDAEYPIVGFREGDGVEKGCVIWLCSAPAGQFAVRPRGTHQERQAAFAAGAAAIGKKLTVRYQELTNDGIPRFPVGIAIRDYE
jgi:DNA ligase-1